MRLRQRDLRLHPFWFLVLVVGFTVLLVVSAYLLHAEAAPDSFRTSVAQVLLQLAILGVVGAAVTAVAGARTKRRDRISDLRTRRSELLRRAAAANQAVQVSWQLIVAHDSPKTYSEQMRLLISVRSDFEDLQEDIRISEDKLLAEPGVIDAALESIVEYLRAGAKEWEQHKRQVDAAWKSGDSVRTCFQNLKMRWIVDALEPTGNEVDAYTSGYHDKIKLVKTQLRKAIFDISA
jgi:hypothetical protein